LRFAIALACGLFLAGPTDAWAGGIPVTEASDAQREQAGVLFKAALAKSKKGDFEGAIADLRASFDLVASPNTKLRISRELLALGRIADAYREAKIAEDLAVQAARIDKKYEAAEKAARDDVAQLRAKVGFVEIDLGPLRGEILVSGRSVSAAEAREPVPVDPGEIVVTLRNPSGVHSTTVTVGAGETRKATVVEEFKEGPRRERPPLSPWDMGLGQQITGVAFGLTGGIALVLFSGLGIANASLHNDVSKQCPNQRCPESLRSDVEEGRRLQLGANVSLGIGLVGLAAGAGFLVPTFFAPKRRSDEGTAASLGVELGVGSLAVGGSF
jgi:hypothetical protein